MPPKCIQVPFTEIRIGEAMSNAGGRLEWCKSSDASQRMSFAVWSSAVFCAVPSPHIQMNP
jgi:hypothetical protein